MENLPKKKDAKGNQLTEKIGGGLNHNHPSVKKYLKARIDFHLEKGNKEDFKKFCKPYGGVSEVLRNYIKNCIK